LSPLPPHLPPLSPHKKPPHPPSFTSLSSNPDSLLPARPSSLSPLCLLTPALLLSTPVPTPPFLSLLPPPRPPHSPTLTTSPPLTPFVHLSTSCSSQRTSPFIHPLPLPIPPPSSPTLHSPPPTLSLPTSRPHPPLYSHGPSPFPTVTSLTPSLSFSHDPLYSHTYSPPLPSPISPPYLEPPHPPPPPPPHLYLFLPSSPPIPSADHPPHPPSTLYTSSHSLFTTPLLLPFFPNSLHSRFTYLPRALFPSPPSAPTLPPFSNYSFLLFILFLLTLICTLPNSILQPSTLSFSSLLSPRPPSSPPPPRPRSLHTYLHTLPFFCHSLSHIFCTTLGLTPLLHPPPPLPLTTPLSPFFPISHPPCTPTPPPTILPPHSTLSPSFFYSIPSPSLYSPSSLIQQLVQFRECSHIDSPPLQSMLPENSRKRR